MTVFRFTKHSLVALLTLLPLSAFAQDIGNIGGTLCRVVHIFTDGSTLGSVGGGIVLIAIIFAGLTALSGRLQWINVVVTLVAAWSIMQAFVIVGEVIGGNAQCTPKVGQTVSPTYSGTNDSDSLSGGSGDDTLTGTTGDDDLTTGGGAGGTASGTSNSSGAGIGDIWGEFGEDLPN